jgi:hypothetical protein
MHYLEESFSPTKDKWHKREKEGERLMPHTPMYAMEEWG